MRTPPTFTHKSVRCRIVVVVVAELAKLVIYPTSGVPEVPVWPLCFERARERHVDDDHYVRRGRVRSAGAQQNTRHVGALVASALTERINMKTYDCYSNFERSTVYVHCSRTVADDAAILPNSRTKLDLRFSDDTVRTI